MVFILLSVYSWKNYSPKHIFIQRDPKCALKAPPNLHFMFFFSLGRWVIGFQRKIRKKNFYSFCPLYHLHDGKQLFFYISLCRALLITFSSSLYEYLMGQSMAEGTAKNGKSSTILLLFHLIYFLSSFWWGFSLLRCTSRFFFLNVVYTQTIVYPPPSPTHIFLADLFWILFFSERCFRWERFRVNRFMISMGFVL